MNNNKKIDDLFSVPLRNPCKYCKNIHANYACDKQIEFIKINIIKNDSNKI